MQFVADSRERYLDDAISTAQKVIRRLPSAVQRNLKESQRIDEI